MCLIGCCFRSSQRGAALLDPVVAIDMTQDPQRFVGESRLFCPIRFC
jgi:hypothetical protein